MHITNKLLKKCVTNFNYIKGNDTFKSGVIYTVSAFLNNGISFILLLFIANLISPEGYGKLSLYNTFLTIISIIIPLASYSYVSVSYFQKGKYVYKDYINGVIHIIFFTSIIFSFFLITFSDSLESIIRINYSFIWISVVVCVFQTIQLISMEVLRIEEKSIKYSVFSTGMASLNFLLTIFLIVYIKYDWEGRVYSQLIVAFVSFIIASIILLKRKLPNIFKVKVKIIKELLIYSLPLVPHVISSWMRQGFDRYIIDFYYTVSEVGIFSFAMNISNIIFILGIAFNATNSVFIYKSLSLGYTQEVKHKLNKLNRIMVVVFALASLIIFLLAWFFIPVLFPEYSDSKQYLFPLVLAGLLQCFYLLFVNFLFYYNRTKEIMYVTFASSIVHVLLSMFLTKHSILLTAYVSVFSQALIFLFIYFLSKKILNKNLSIV